MNDPGIADAAPRDLAVRLPAAPGWAQRACGAAPARRHLGTTPPEWAGFAQRNAELAARLAD